MPETVSAVPATAPVASPVVEAPAPATLDADSAVDARASELIRAMQDGVYNEERQALLEEPGDVAAEQVATPAEAQTSTGEETSASNELAARIKAMREGTARRVERKELEAKLERAAQQEAELLELRAEREQTRQLAAIMKDPAKLFAHLEAQNADPGPWIEYLKKANTDPASLIAEQAAAKAAEAAKAELATLIKKQEEHLAEQQRQIRVAHERNAFAQLAASEKDSPVAGFIEEHGMQTFIRNTVELIDAGVIPPRLSYPEVIAFLNDQIEQSAQAAIRIVSRGKQSQPQTQVTHKPAVATTTINARMTGENRADPTSLDDLTLDERAALATRRMMLEG